MHTAGGYGWAVRNQEAASESIAFYSEGVDGNDLLHWLFKQNIEE